MAAFSCAYCGQKSERPAGHVNRSVRNGLNLYCGKLCSRLGRRLNRSASEKVAQKAAYDRHRRAILGDSLLEKKRAKYHQSVAENPSVVRAKEKANRAKRKDAHNEYCMRPAYRDWKKEYDKRHRAEKFYGPFAEAFLILQNLEEEVSQRASRYEIYMERGTINKSLKRKRDYEKSVGCNS